MEITVTPDAARPVLPFNNLFRHRHMGDEIVIDFSWELTDTQPVEIAKYLSQEDNHVRWLGINLAPDLLIKCLLFLA